MSLDEIVAAIDDPDERRAAAARIRHEVARRQRAASAASAPRIVRTAKRCPVCAETKPVAEFGRNAARPDGLQSVCRGCR